MAWSKDNSVAAKLAAAEALAQAERAELAAISVDDAIAEVDVVVAENTARFLPAVATVALRDSTYPAPLNGDTVRVTGTSTTYRFATVGGWVVTDVYNATAIDNVTAQLADNEKKLNPAEYKKQAVVTIIDDDGYASFLDRWKPLADSKGIKVGVAAVSSWVGTTGYMTLANLKQLQTEGFEILSHSNSHQNPNSTTDAAWATDFQTSKNWMVANGFNNVDTVVYPYGFSTVTADVAIAKKNAIRSIFDYALDYSSLGGLNNLPIDKFQILRFNTTLDEATMKAKVDEALTNKSWLILATHSNQYWDATVYGNVIDYIKSKNIPIKTFGEAINEFDSTINIGDINGDYFMVSKRGDVAYKNKADSSVIPTWAKSTQPFTYAIDTPATAYPKFMKSMTEVRTPSDTYFNAGGMLETYYGNSGFSYQIFTLFGTGKIHERRWIDGSSTWGAFFEISKSTSQNPASYAIDTSITAYRQFVFTDIEIKSASDTYFATGGLMRVYSGGAGFSFALFYLYNSNVVYKRRWSGSAWLAWEKISGEEVFTTATRPTTKTVGFTGFDTTLGKPIWLKTTPSTWVDATGTVV